MSQIVWVNNFLLYEEKEEKTATRHCGRNEVHRRIDSTGRLHYASKNSEGRELQQYLNIVKVYSSDPVASIVIRDFPFIFFSFLIFVGFWLWL